MLVFSLSFSSNLHSQRVENTTLQIPVEKDDLPLLLSETGLFKDLQTLEVEDGILPYEPNVTFWSDHAIKKRWVYIPHEEQIGYSLNRGWDFPEGSVWVKHFDLEMERGNPESREKIETRLLVKTSFGVYGVSYIWNEDKTDATLVGDDAVALEYDIVDESGVSRKQQWAIPSRNECLVCHVPAGGLALSFNTRQLNKEMVVNGSQVNFLQYLGESGILDTEFEVPEVQPRFSNIDDTDYSLDHRARSYLAVNCAYCHAPGGGPESDPFDARPHRNLDRSGLLDENRLVLDYGVADVDFLVERGDHEHSAVWLKMAGADGIDRMPPLATFERDFAGEDLIERWINETLAGYLTFDEWQEATFVDANALEADWNQDPDGDGDINEIEFLNRTNPNDYQDHSRIAMTLVEDGYRVVQKASEYADYQLEVSEDFVTWELLELEANSPRTLPEGESEIEVVLPVLDEVGPAKFVRSRVGER